MFRSILCVAIAVMLASANAARADECQNVSILKRFVGVPDVCNADGCESWTSSAVLGPGTWQVETTFANIVGGPYQPVPEGFIILITASDTFTAKDGDQLYATNAVSVNTGIQHAAGMSYVRGGTGRFADAYGNLYLRVDNENGRARLDGELCGVKGLSVLD